MSLFGIMRHRTLCLRLIALTVMAVFVVAIYGISIRDLITVPTIEKRFGFVADTTYVPHGIVPREVLTISSIKIGGEIDRLGFLPDDVVLSHGRASFFDALSMAEGGETVTVIVGRGARGSALEVLEKHSIEIVLKGDESAPPG